MRFAEIKIGDWFKDSNNTLYKKISAVKAETPSGRERYFESGDRVTQYEPTNIS